MEPRKKFTDFTLQTQNFCSPQFLNQYFVTLQFRFSPKKQANIALKILFQLPEFKDGGRLSFTTV